MRAERSAGAFVFRWHNGNFELLLLKRLNEKHYDLPKGHIEKGETEEQAAKRETLEETGLKVSFIPPFRQAVSYTFHNGKTRVRKSVVYFLAWATNDRVTTSKEHKGYKWCAYKEAVQKVHYKDSVPAVNRAFDYIARAQKMYALNQEYARLPGQVRDWNLSRNFVPGEGPVDAKVMFIGQAPGANEDTQRRPFIGRSGQLLTKVLTDVGIDRSTVYISSVVQFFPPKNRAPTPKEIELCRGFLMRQIDIVRPRVVVFLGNISSQNVIGVGEVRKNHGRIITKNGVHYMLTLHPAAVLRNNHLYATMAADLRNLVGRIKQTL